MASQKRIAVIGAGIAGLTCAYELHKAGHDVVVYEKESWVGGRMGTREKNGFLFDIGANHLIPLYREMRSYIEEFGLTWYPMSNIKYGLYKKGTTFSPFAAISKLAKFRLSLGFLFGRKTTSDEYLNLSLLSNLDTENGYDYLKRKIGKDATDYLGDGFVSAYQFYSIRETSKAAILAGMESIQFENNKWDLYLTKGGIGALANAFSQRLNVQLGKTIKQITSDETGVFVDGDHVDAVVLAAPGTISKKIYTNPTDEQRALLDLVQYGSSIVVAYRIPVTACPKETLIWTPKKNSPVVASYSLEYTKGDDLIHEGETLLLVFLHDESAQQWMNEDDETIFEHTKTAFAHIAPWLKDTSLLYNHDLQRWPDAMPMYYQGYITKTKEFLDTHQGDNNVWFCGDYLNALWTEGALRCGQRVAAGMIEHYG